jgi:hypothetical protein
MSTSTKSTYTRHEAEQALGIKSRSAFHYLKTHYPAAFIVIKQGTDRSNPTLYDRVALDKFVELRNALRKVRS